MRKNIKKWIWFVDSWILSFEIKKYKKQNLMDKKLITELKCYQPHFLKWIFTIFNVFNIDLP